MIFETIELINENLTITELEAKINSGIYDDILSSYSILVMTKQGLVKIASKTKEITINPTVDLSGYVPIEEGKTLISTETLNKLVQDEHNHDNKVQLDSITEDKIKFWDDKVNSKDMPIITFEDNGILSVTINNETHKYTPKIDTELT